MNMTVVVVENPMSQPAKRLVGTISRYLPQIQHGVYLGMLDSREHNRLTEYLVNAKVNVSISRPGSGAFGLTTTYIGDVARIRLDDAELFAVVKKKKSTKTGSISSM